MPHSRFSCSSTQGSYDVGLLNTVPHTCTVQQDALLATTKTQRHALPTEVWERVIDLCRTHYHLDGTRNMHLEVRLRTDGTYETWRMCSLVCKSWLPRSRYNLLAEICISRPEQIDKLLRTLENHPALAEHVVKLTVSLPPDATTAYIPFNRKPLSRVLSKCQVLDLRGVDWRHYHPRWHDLHSVPHLSWVHIVELLLPIDYLTPGGAARLIWSHPALTRLTLFHGLGYYGKLQASDMPTSQPSYRAFASRREKPDDACHNLDQMHIITVSQIHYSSFVVIVLSDNGL